MKTKSKIASASDPENPPLTKDFFKRAQLGVMHAKSTRVELDPDVAKVFKDSKAVNDALRAMEEIRRVLEPVKRKKTA